MDIVPLSENQKMISIVPKRLSSGYDKQDANITTKKCALSDCVSNLHKNYRSKELNFHSIPTSRKRRKLWVKACGQDFKEGAVLCSRHFKPYDQLGTQLTSWAIPVFHLNPVKSKQKKFQLLNVSTKKTARPRRVIIPNLDVDAEEPDTNHPEESARVDCPAVKPHYPTEDICYQRPSEEHSYNFPGSQRHHIVSLQTQIEKLQEKSLKHQTEINTHRKRHSRLLAKNKLLQKQVEEARETIEKLKQKIFSIDGVRLDLLQSRKNYNEDQRNFAMDLFLLSSKAYNFLREKCIETLPSNLCIRRWLTKRERMMAERATGVVAETRVQADSSADATATTPKPIPPLNTVTEGTQRNSQTYGTVKGSEEVTIITLVEVDEPFRTTLGVEAAYDSK